jgi:hypothetical protein
VASAAMMQACGGRPSEHSEESNASPPWKEREILQARALTAPGSLPGWRMQITSKHFSGSIGCFQRVMHEKAFLFVFLESARRFPLMMIRPLASVCRDVYGKTECGEEL